MKETLEMMKGLITGKEKGTDEKELISLYQLYKLPNILAYFFVNNIGIIRRTNALYPLLTDEDKASFCLVEIDKCLLNFDYNRDIKFITYFIKCYKNTLRMETELLLAQKRKVILYSEQECAEEVLYIDDIEIDNVDEILNNYNLTVYEKKQCKLLNEGYTVKEIAQMLKLSTITIYNRNKQIREKISKSIINFT